MLHVVLHPSSEAKTGDSTSAAKTSEPASEPALTMPYKASYSSDISIGKQSNALTVLNSYKAWETGDMTALANTISDSVNFNFSDGTKFTGTRILQFKRQKNTGIVLHQ